MPKTMVQSLICLFAALMAAGSAAQERTPWMQRPLPFNSPGHIERLQKRARMSDMDRVLDVLGIKPGMAVLNVETSHTGDFAYKFAQRLQGTGRVFSTDFDPEAVEYVKSQAAQKGLANLSAVLVNADGVDPFYVQNSYDLVFISHGLQYLSDASAFITGLKKRLLPGGRFAVLKTREADRFEPGDFTDVRGLLAEVLKEPAIGGPFSKYLNWCRKEAQNAAAGRKIDETELKKKLAIIFNQLLFDPEWFPFFLEKGRLSFREDLALTPEERGFVNIKLASDNAYHLLDSKGALSKKYRKHYLNVPMDILMINQTLLIQRFRPYLYGGHSPYQTGHRPSSRTKSVERLFESAGYKVDAEYNFVPYCDLLVFSPGKAGLFPWLLLSGLLAAAGGFALARRVRPRKAAAGLGIALLFICHPAQAATGWDPPPPPFSPEGHVEKLENRAQRYRIDQIMDALDIKPGMTILNIETRHSEEFAYKFAERLQGSGRVFTTDADPKMIEYIKKRGRRLGLSNLQPVLIAAEGMDGFYNSNMYDLIFMGHEFNYPANLRAFLLKLKQRLARKGHFAVLMTRMTDRFRPEDFTDVPGLLKEVLKEPAAGGPFSKYLNWCRADAQKAAAGGRMDVPELKKKLALVFNQLLFDPDWYPHFLVRGTLSFREDLVLTPVEQDFINTKIHFAGEAGMLDGAGALKEGFKQKYRVPQDILAINHTLLIQRFRKYIYGGRSPYLPGHPMSSATKGVEQKFKDAGYKVDAEHNFVPYSDLVVFSPNTWTDIVPAVLFLLLLLIGGIFAFRPSGRRPRP